jgi:DNA-binding response OmpR family regulator
LEIAEVSFGLHTTDTILLAEDSEEDLELMRIALRRARVENPVSVVRDGQQAIDYLEGVGRYRNRAEFPLPCIIITDLKMPRTDGFALLEWLRDRAEFARVPKLVLSASGMDVDRRRAAELGVCAYFVKPAGFHELVEVVRAIDDDWIANHCPLSKTGS